MRKIWFQSITSFDPVPHQKAMLCGWIGGAEAEYAETLSEDVVGQTCVELLRKFLGRDDIPYPKGVYRYDVFSAVYVVIFIISVGPMIILYKRRSDLKSLHYLSLHILVSLLCFLESLQ